MEGSNNPKENVRLNKLVEFMEENDKALAILLKDKILKSPEKMAMIESALTMAGGKDWQDIPLTEDNPEAINTLGNLLAQWDTKVDRKPKTPEQHQEEVEEFVKKIK